MRRWQEARRRRGPDSGTSQRSSAPRHHAPTPSMTLMVAAVLLLPLYSILSNSLVLSAQAAATTAPARAPQLDFDALGGSLGVFGSFAGIELFGDDGTTSFGINHTAASDQQANLLSLDSSNQVKNIASVQGTTNVVARCGAGIYFGGAFSAVTPTAPSKLATVTTSNIAVYFPSNGSITSLHDGVDGAVSALACDTSDNNTLYIGGAFKQPVNAPSGGYDGAVAVWNIASASFSPVAFGGFRGDNVKVLAIAINDGSASSNGKSVIFGGEFTTYWLNDTSVNDGANVTVTTSSNGAVTITTSNSSSSGNTQVVDVYPSLGSSLIPISLADAEISASSSSSDSRYNQVQSIFCPAGEDGSTGSTWLARQGDEVNRITARLFAPLEVGGFRIGNTRVNGAGAQTFGLTAIPSNEVISLRYRQDPSSSSSQLQTCSDACPLSHDASVEYEDFIIASPSSSGAALMTGFEMTITSHYGSSGGLHSLQLLSSGSVSYAIVRQNNGKGRGVCNSGPASVYGRSSSTQQPTSQISWDPTQVTSSTISGTNEGVLCGATPVDLDASESPVVTWYPYIGQDGDYEIKFFTPACSFDATCGQRGAVDVQVAITGTSGSSSLLTIINQEVEADTYTTIYSGRIAPIADDQKVKVTMRLSSTERPQLAHGQGDKYYLVADKILTVAKSTDGNGATQIKVGTGMTSINVSTSQDASRQLAYATGHGLFEWSVADVNAISPTLDISSTVPQRMRPIGTSSTTNRLPFGLNSLAKVSELLALPEQSALAVAGTFQAGQRENIIITPLDAASATSFSQQGLNGPVESVSLDNGYLYAAGNFSQTAGGGVSGLRGRARLSLSSTGSQWEALNGLSAQEQANFIAEAPSAGDLLVSYAGQSISFWNPANASVSNAGPLLVGKFASSTAGDDPSVIYLAGQVSAFASHSSSGSARVTKNGVQPYDFGFGSGTNQAPVTRSSVANPTTRSLGSSLVSNLKSRLRKRQNGNTLPAPTSLPQTSLSTSDDPVILAGAHWHNATANEDVAILGGRFVSRDGQVTNLGVLDSSGSIRPLGAPDITGEVRSLVVADDVLWVGRSGSSGLSLSTISLDSEEGSASSTIPTTVSPSAAGTPAAINVLLARDSNIVAAGSFGSVNSVVGCSNICEWDEDSKDWIAYGNGLEGIVAAAALTKDSIFVGGSFVFNNTSAYVMSWDYDDKVWTALPAEGLPGPVLSITVDDETSIFVTGSQSEASSYIRRWDGQNWVDFASTSNSAVDSLDLASSSIQQVALMPVSSVVAESSYFSARDRVLLVSGQLNLASTGSASSAIFDGTRWYPYLSALLSNGDTGTIAGYFYPAAQIQFGRHHYLAVGLVILISMAIALGVVFLGVLIALIIALSRRHDDGHAYPPVMIPPYDADYAGSEATSPTPFFSDKSRGKSTPTPMLETLHAATAALSSGHPGAQRASGVRVVEDDRASHHQEPSSASELDPVGGVTSEEDSVYGDPDEGDDSLPLRGVRYTFDAEREEELSISTSDMVEVLDDTDDNWHIVRRLRDGKQGLVPSAFLT